MAIKTLLVGLGGTGCEIVAGVKKRIGEKDSNVQYIGFDTDSKWEGTDGIPIVYTSREMTVRQYLMGFPNWQEWFPDNAQLMARSMVKGAGQVRSLSRLAFAETINSGRIGLLEEAIRKLHISEGEVTPQNLRVMIVSSFAGGTGSGMFIQMALFIRDYVRQHYHGEVIVRGLFALPDLFKEKMDSDDQTVSIYANAYASLKELNAINNVCLSTDESADRIRMKIDGMFDSKKDRGKAEKKPFDFIFFVDDVNSNGRVLRSLEDYKELMITATHMQVYSPLTDMGDSREDNIILAIIGGNGKPLYGSVGASKIVYPYKDIVRYCGFRATVESISDVWSLIDKDYKLLEAENKKQRAIDSTVPLIVRSEHFISKVNTLFDEGNERFNFIRNALYTEDESKKQIDRVDDYFERVLSFVKTRIERDDEITGALNNTGVTEKQLKNRLTVKVSSNETALKNYQNTIDERIRLLRNSTVQSIVPNELNSALNSHAEWNIEELLSINGRIVHPLSARMLLYKFRRAVKEQQTASATDASSSLKQINDYFKKAYDIVGTDVVETASDRATSKGILKRSRFRDEYLLKSNAQKNRLQKYCAAKFISVVFDDIIGRIDMLIQQYERMFDNLDNITRALEDEIEVLEKIKHADVADTTTYVCASPEEKQDVYNSLGFNCTDNNENEVYGIIFRALYAAGQSERKAKLEGKRASAKSEREQNTVLNNNMTRLFIDNVVKSNIKDLEMAHDTELNLNIYEAIRMSAGEGAITERGIVASTFDKATPYLKHNITRPIESAVNQNKSVVDSAYTMTFWGVHPEVYNDIQSNNPNGNVGLYFKAGDGNTVPEVVSSNEYSRYEVSCYQALYCVTLEEIPKFVETGDSFGVFYENYSKRVSGLRNGKKNIICPHIDYNWYKREYLPMISSDKNLEDDRNTARAMWLALIYGGLPEETIDGVKVIYASFADKNGKELYPSMNLTYNGAGIRITHTYELFKALQFNEIVSERLLEVYTKFYDDDRHISGNLELTGPRAKRFVKKLISEDNTDRNALNILARFVTAPGMTDSERIIFTEALTSLIDEFFDGVSETRKMNYRNLIFKASRFGSNKTSRSKYERLINFIYWSGEKE